MKKLAVALAAVAVMIFGFGSVANAYPPGGPSVTVSDTTVGSGGATTVTTNCTPGETVTVTLGSSSASETCPSTGSVSVTITAPTAPGSFSGSVVGSVSGVLGAFDVVVSSTPPAPTGGLPATGSGGTSTMTFVALGLLVVGIGLFIAATIRRRQAPTAA